MVIPFHDFAEELAFDIGGDGVASGGIVSLAEAGLSGFEVGFLLSEAAGAAVEFEVGTEHLEEKSGEGKGGADDCDDEVGAGKAEPAFGGAAEGENESGDREEKGAIEREGDVAAELLAGIDRFGEFAVVVTELVFDPVRE